METVLLTSTNCRTGGVSVCDACVTRFQETTQVSMYTKLGILNGVGDIAQQEMTAPVGIKEGAHNFRVRNWGEF